MSNLMDKESTSIDNHIIDQIGELIIGISADNRVLFYNKVAEVTLKIPKKEILGSNIFAVCKKHKVILPFDFRTLKSSATTNPDFVGGEIIFSDGSKILIQLKYLHNPKHGDDKDRYLVIGRDVSELTGYKNTSYNTNLYLNYIIENLPEYIYWKDKNLVYQGCNKHVAAYLNLTSSQDVVGKTDYDFGWDKDRINTLQEIDSEILKTGINNITEDVIPKNDGSYRVMLTNKAALRDDQGNIIGIVGVSTDMTEKKLLSEKLKEQAVIAQRANKSKSDFISLMSHEVNSPLNTISMFADLSLATKQANKVKEYLNIIINEVFVTVEMIRNVRRLIEIQDGDVSYSFLPCYIHDLINKLIPRFPIKKGTHFQVIIDDKVPNKIWLDESNVLRILDVIINNAFKYTKKGTVKIEIKHLEKQSMDKRYISITVSDTGSGIPKSQLKTIFMTFTKSETMGDDKYHSTGIKLPLAKATAEMMGGELSLKSIEGKGTKVLITLPYIIPPMSKSELAIKKMLKMKPLKKTKLTLVGKLEPATILLIEDNYLSLEGEKLSLESLGCTVDAAINAKSALAFIKKGKKYDFILIDITLPDMNGIVLSKKIRKLVKYEPNFIAVTSHGEVGDQERYVDDGIYAVIPKPVTIDKLKECLLRFQKALKESKEEASPKTRATKTKKKK